MCVLSILNTLGAKHIETTQIKLKFDANYKNVYFRFHIKNKLLKTYIVKDKHVRELNHMLQQIDISQLQINVNENQVF